MYLAVVTVFIVMKWDTSSFRKLVGFDAMIHKGSMSHNFNLKLQITFRNANYVFFILSHLFTYLNNTFFLLKHECKTVLYKTNIYQKEQNL